MTHSAVGNSDYSLLEYYKKDNISEDCKNKMDCYDLVILPYKYNEDFYFADETVSFYKYCKERNLNIEILSDESIKVRSLHSFDIWMPLIYIANSVILPIIINLVSDYIIQKRKGREEERCDVDITFKIKNGDQFKEFHFKGDAETFKDTFEKVDINNL